MTVFQQPVPAHGLTPDAGQVFTPPDFGRSALINLGGCDPEILRSPVDIRTWVDCLIEDISMQAFGEPQQVRFGEGDLYGDTHIQLITTSHIAVHTVHHNNTVYIDLFSCAAFSAQYVLAQAKEFFGAQAAELAYFERRDPTAEGAPS